MWPAFIVAALAVTAIAAPHQHKRNYIMIVETETDVVWVTQVVTFTANGAPVYTTSVTASLTSSVVSYSSYPATQTSAASTAPEHHNHFFHGPHETLPTSILPPVYTIESSASSTSLPAATSTSVVHPTVYSPVATTTSTVVPPAPTSTVSPTTTSIPVSTTVPVVPASVVQPTFTIASTSTAQPSTTQSSSSRPTSYSELVVAHHNIHRRNHSAPDMVWDAGLANAAATIASSCKYAHNVDVDQDIIGGYGQNIAAGVADNNVSAIITELFYNGEVGWFDGLYGQAQPVSDTFEDWGHFSQLVWHDTTKVGCATQHCDVLQGINNDDVPPYFTVCNYQSPGNIVGEYTQVGASIGMPTVHWDYFS